MTLKGKRVTVLGLGTRGGGAASFELFNDEFDRGERFNGEVKKL